MSMKIIRTSLASVVTVFALAFAGFANAALFGSHFDPLGFVGDGLFKFDDACLADGTYTGTACNVQLLSASLDLTNAPLVGPATGTAHFDFTPVLPSTAIFDIVVSGGVLVGVDSDVFGGVFSTSCTGDLCDGQPRWIQWFTDSNRVALYTGCQSTNFVGRLSVAEADSTDCSPNTDNPVIADTVTFTRIPEPGTLFLIAGALIAAGLSRRRSTFSRAA